MKFLPLLAAAALAAGTASAHAQAADTPRLETGREVTGQLTAAAPRSDGHAFNDWVFHATLGERIIIDLRSDDFDTFLILGTWYDGEWEELAINDDSRGSTDSRIVFPVAETRDYVVRVRAFGDDETGSYTLLAARSATPAFRPLTIGTPVEGVLDDDSPSFGDGDLFELWSFSAREGERFTVDVRSDDFDTVVSILSLADGEYEELASDDDGGDGTNSRITDWVAPATGQFLIVVESFSGGSEGRYTVHLTKSEG